MPRSTIRRWQWSVANLLSDQEHVPPACRGCVFVSLAVHDPLTGLPNRRYFRDALAFEVERARRLRYPLGLLMVDVDQFAAMNDRFGHPAGDLVLVAVARALSAGLRRTDLAARIGGDEFAAILPGAGPNAIGAVGNNVRRAVAGTARLPASGEGHRQITVSVGGAALGQDTVDAEALVSKADRALYEAKRGGRNRVQVA